MEDSNSEELPKIYDVRLMFYLDKRVVNVQIRYLKKGHSTAEKVEEIVPYPEEIRDSDLSWTRFEGEKIAVYHRKDKYKYVDLNHNLTLPTAGLSHSLERLVYQVHNKRLLLIKQKHQTK